MTGLALLVHRSEEDVLAWRQQKPVSVAQFLVDVWQMASALPAGNHVLNACSDRYRFAVGLAAALATGKISLLPPNLTAEMVLQLRSFAPDTFCLTDQKLTIDLPCVSWADALQSGARTGRCDVPMPAASQIASIMFTSGSTGQPVAHRKSWGSMVASTRAEAACLGLLDGQRHSLVATVPPQHMFGLESTVLLAFQSGAAMHAGHPFFPADICAALAESSEPSVLVTTPAHLKVLLASGLEIPPLELVLSATAPMPPQLAAETENRLKVQLFEIYGSTETGQIAFRRTTETAQWTLFPGVKLRAAEGGASAVGGHVEELTPLADELELLDERHFLLHGRTADLVNIAGKRSSLGYLNHQLNALEGVLDGAFFMPDDDGQGKVVRLMAFAVAPGLEAAALLSALRERVDPLFLPRPLVLLEALPRNSTGKLPRDTLQQLARDHHRKSGLHAG